MNIDLKLTVDEIIYISRNIEAVRPVSLKAISKLDFFTWSIIFDVAQKVLKKEHSFDSSNGVDTRKKYKLKIKYHEAVVLEKFMSGYQDNESDHFYANMARNITSQINQKLA